MKTQLLVLSLFISFNAHAEQSLEQLLCPGHMKLLEKKLDCGSERIDGIMEKAKNSIRVYLTAARQEALAVAQYDKALKSDDKEDRLAGYLTEAYKKADFDLNQIALAEENSDPVSDLRTVQGNLQAIRYALRDNADHQKVLRGESIEPGQSELEAYADPENRRRAQRTFDKNKSMAELKAEQADLENKEGLAGNCLNQVSLLIEQSRSCSEKILTGRAEPYRYSYDDESPVIERSATRVNGFDKAEE
jgi:hypothetical protein